jgi:hypothetical protein
MLVFVVTAFRGSQHAGEKLAQTKAIEGPDAKLLSGSSSIVILSNPTQVAFLSFSLHAYEYRM